MNYTSESSNFFASLFLSDINVLTRTIHRPVQRETNSNSTSWIKTNVICKLQVSLCFALPRTRAALIHVSSPVDSYNSGSYTAAVSCVRHFTNDEGDFLVSLLLL